MPEISTGPRLLVGICVWLISATVGRGDETRYFDQVWQNVHESFFDPKWRGLDWEAVGEKYRPAAVASQSAEEEARVINRMLDELATSHTSFFTPDDIAYYFLIDLFKTGDVKEQVERRFSGPVAYDGIAIHPMKRGEEWFVRGVLHGGPADRAGLKVGDRLVTVDGEPFHPIRSFRGRNGDRVDVFVMTRDSVSSGKILSVEVERLDPEHLYLEAMRESVRIIPHRGKNVGYIRAWSYAGKKYHELLEEETRTGRLAKADSLILDIRGGWGGASPLYLNLFNSKIPHLEMIGRDGQTSTFDSQWRKPVSLLIDGGSRSGKELLAFGFKKHRLGPVIGTRTAGAVTAGRVFPVGEDGLLYLAVLDVRVDGERLEGRGVAPDYEVPFEIPYAHGDDPQLHKALEVLTSK